MVSMRSGKFTQGRQWGPSENRQGYTNLQRSINHLECSRGRTQANGTSLDRRASKGAEARHIEGLPKSPKRDCPHSESMPAPELILLQGAWLREQ